MTADAEEGEEEEEEAEVWERLAAGPKGVTPAARLRWAAQHLCGGSSSAAARGGEAAAADDDEDGERGEQLEEEVEEGQAREEGQEPPPGPITRLVLKGEAAGASSLQALAYQVRGRLLARDKGEKGAKKAAFLCGAERGLGCERARSEFGRGARSVVACVAAGALRKRTPVGVVGVGVD